MDLTLLELNELIYCVGTGINKGQLVNKDVLERRCTEIDQLMEAEANAVQRWG
jgi:hypothetical protein